MHAYDCFLIAAVTLLQEIRSLYHQIKEAMKEVDAILNQQWSSFMQKKSSALRKSRRRAEVDKLV